MIYRSSRPIHNHLKSLAIPSKATREPTLFQQVMRVGAKERGGGTGRGHGSARCTHHSSCGEQLQRILRISQPSSPQLAAEAKAPLAVASSRSKTLPALVLASSL